MSNLKCVILLTGVLFASIGCTKSLGQNNEDSTYRLLFKNPVSSVKTYSLEKSLTENKGRTLQVINKLISYQSAKYSGGKVTSILKFGKNKISIPILVKDKINNYTMIYACCFNINSTKYWGFSFEPVSNHNSKGSVFHVIVSEVNSKPTIAYNGWNDSESIDNVIGYYICSGDVVYAQNLSNKVSLYRILPNTFTQLANTRIYLTEDVDGNFTIDKSKSHWCR